MKLVVGLGNPGPRYAGTRHNVGFRIATRFAERHAIALDAHRFGGRFGRASAALGGGTREDVAVLLPEGFMNRSGRAVADAVAMLPIGPLEQDLLVVFDDVDLPFGRLRLRPGGSAGGHRGLADVIACLGRDDFPRLRFGVGRPEVPMETADWVLQRFSAQEEARLPPLIDAAAAAVAAALADGVATAMNRVNRDPATATKRVDRDPAEADAPRPGAPPPRGDPDLSGSN